VGGRGVRAAVVGEAGLKSFFFLRERSNQSKPSFRNLFHINGILQNDYSDNLEHNSKDKSKHTVPILARTFEIFFVAFQTNT
jgi:hypothetical protein